MSRFRKERRSPSLHIAPLIDCVLLLLIFFMLTATYVNRGIPVDLPTTKGGNPIEKGLVITITRDGELFFRGEPVTLITLRERIAEQKIEEADRIMLQVDRSVPVGRVVEVIDITRDLGSKVSLITEISAPSED